LAEKKEKVKFLSYEQIAEQASDFLKKLKYEGIIPVPIEKIIDRDIKINIVPIPNLFRTFDINAITSSDLKTIYVDEYLYTNLDRAYRFTLAHELGHIVLHRDFYRSIKIKGLSDWKRFIADVEEKDYQYLELQANNFGGLLLVPQKELAEHFELKLKGLIRSSIMERFEGLNRADYVDLTLKIIAEKLTDVFEVSSRVIKIRMEKSNLVTRIP
jgi:Zn-dependent peptidase ImmA (M78 family)